MRRKNGVELGNQQVHNYIKALFGIEELWLKCGFTNLCSRLPKLQILLNIMQIQKDVLHYVFQDIAYPTCLCHNPTL